MTIQIITLGILITCIMAVTYCLGYVDGRLKERKLLLKMMREVQEEGEA